MAQAQEHDAQADRQEEQPARPEGGLHQPAHLHDDLATAAPGHGGDDPVGADPDEGEEREHDPSRILLVARELLHEGRPERAAEQHQHRRPHERRGEEQHRKPRQAETQDSRGHEGRHTAGGNEARADDHEHPAGRTEPAGHAVDLVLLDNPLERRATERPAPEPTAQRVKDHVPDEDAHRAGQRGPPEADDAFGREEARGEARRILGDEGAEDDDEDQDPEAGAIRGHQVRIRLGRRYGRRALRRLTRLDGRDETDDLKRGFGVVAALDLDEPGLRHELGRITGGVDRGDPVALAMDEQRRSVPGAQHRLGVGQVAVEEDAGVTAVIRQAVGQPEMGRGDVEQEERDVMEEVDELVGDGVAEERVFLRAGRGDQRQRGHAVRILRRDREGDHPAHAFADEMEAALAESRLHRTQHIGGDALIAHRRTRTMVGGRPAGGVDQTDVGGAPRLDEIDGGLVPIGATVRETGDDDDRQGGTALRTAERHEFHPLGQLGVGQAVGGSHPAGDQDQQDVGGQHDPLHRDAPEVALAIGEGGHPNLIKGRPPQGARREGR